jgi:hypothetical protein
VPEEETASQYDIVYLHYIKEESLESCPQLKFPIGWHQYFVVLDTGCEASIWSEQIYSELTAKFCSNLFPVYDTNLDGTGNYCNITVKFASKLVISF